jgi:signal recognition particle receptor subunit beta
MKYKIIVAGPVGAGKTTAINSLTSDNAFMTDAAVSDEVTSKRKSNTTVAMDFGVVHINDNDVAHVYGTPGQQRFNFMWEILSEGAHGLILLLDNTRNYPFRDLKYFTESFADLIKSTALVVGVTRSDVSDEVPVEAYQQWLGELNLVADVRFIDAREGEEVQQLVCQLVDLISVSEDRCDVPIIPASIDHETLEIKSDENLELGRAFAHNTAIEKRELVLEKEVVDNEADRTMVSAIGDKTEAGLPAMQVATASSYVADEAFNLDENTMAQVATLTDVNGVTLTNSYGELLHSTISDDDINEFIAFLSGIAPALEDASGMGTINRIMLRGPQDENLTVFVEKERSLGVSSNKAASVPALSQKIEDMLQWV